MADQELKMLVAQGVQALKAGGEVATKATGGIQDASSPERQAALQAGSKTSEQRAQRIVQALQETGRAACLALLDRRVWHAPQHAAKLGMSQTEQGMRASLEEAKQENQRYTALADEDAGRGLGVAHPSTMTLGAAGAQGV